ncbi:MAG: O-antigen ligase family protein [Proteobacteria bacterium]|nr:O-antigen ligase family protein [Pseudomonadota bacterium]
MLFIVSPFKETILTFGFFFLLPIGLNYHPILIPARDFFKPIVGVVIYGYDIPLFFLFMLLLKRLCSIERKDIDLILPVSIPFLLIFMSAVLGSPRIESPTVIKFWSLVTVFKCFLTFLIVANSIRTKDILKFIFYLFLVSVFFQAFICLAQIISGSSLGLGFLGETETSVETVTAGSKELLRVGGSMSKNALASYLSFIIPINFALFFTKIQLRTKICFFLPVILLAFTLEILTFSRGAWMGLAVGGTLTFYGCICRLSGRKVLSLFFVSIVIVAFIVLILALSESVRQRLFEDDYGSAIIRIPLMINALNMILHNPFLGVGLGNYTSVNQHYDIFQWISIVFPWPVHNDFLLIGAEMGLPAMLSFCFIIVVVLFKLLQTAFQSKDDLLGYTAFALIGGIVAFSIHHLVAYVYVMLNTPFWSFMGIAFALIFIDRRERKKDSAEETGKIPQ